MSINRSFLNNTCQIQTMREVNIFKGEVFLLVRVTSREDCLELGIIIEGLMEVLECGRR